MSDSTLFERSKLKEKLFSNQWPGHIVSPLRIGNVEIEPYIMGDGAFSLSKHDMKTCSKDEIAADPDLREWEMRATATRKTVECAFGILKHRFSTLLSGIMLHNEEDAVYLVTACLILHNLCLDSGDDGTDFLPSDEDEIIVLAESTNEGKIVQKLY